MSEPRQKFASNDTTRIGEIAAQQPLSGVKIVSATSVKGFNGSTFLHVEEPQKSTVKKPAA